MSDKEVKQVLNKQLGCMNGILQIFDHRYLLGQRRHGRNQKRLLSGQSNNGGTEVSNDKEKSPEVVSKEKHILAIELPRSSFSSSTSSTTKSLLEGTKRVQTELSSSFQSAISEPSLSPFSHKKQPDLFIQSPDIRDVVRDSMTREPRVLSIKTTAKDERVSSKMKHVDSPRPFSLQKPIQYERIYRDLKELKETTRFSCDGRESRYQLKSNTNIKELPRLSLDSRRGRISNSTNNPISNKQPSSSVVARLMGLEALTPSIDESRTLKPSSCLNEESVLNSKSPRKKEKLKHDCTYVSPRIHKPQRAVKVSHVLARIPLETAPWKQEGGGGGPKKPPFKCKEGPRRVKPGSQSIYNEIEKRLTEDEFKTTGKDLRALKQILEAMQKTKKTLDKKEHAFNNSSIDARLSQKVDQPGSPTITQPKVKPAKARQDLGGRNRLRDPNIRDRKAISKPRLASNLPECSETLSPKTQRSKNCINRLSTNLSRPKRQPGVQRTPLSSMNGNPKAKSMDSLQDRSETRNMSQQRHTVSLQSENDSKVTRTKWAQEVNSPFRPKENHKGNIAEWLTEEKSTVDHTKHTMEQPSPVSVLDAFYTEDTPSPVKKKVIAFNDYENLQLKEQEQARINNLPNSTNLDQYSEFNKMKLRKRKNNVHQTEQLKTNPDDATVNHTVTSSCEDETGDHRYIEEIILASGCLKDLDRTTAVVQLHPTVSFINPELFHVLEKTKTCTEHTGDSYNQKFMLSKLRRELVFDTVNDVLGHKLAMLSPLGPHKGRILNADKLLKELCSGIDGLQNSLELGVSDTDEVTNIINADVNKRSQDWDEYCDQLPGLVLDIERLIFKDLICEVVNGEVTSLQDWPMRSYCRRLFPV
ncbi:hypothetical protein QVD17_06607 [Tagetes erecta]|uniref:DUF4378 domain-containing protein n=1 Tax=Tagetes erecta TaxID=13708 RepID=A0AAD8PCC8_TARER|nr:hypothetical protein QVD17_06607 [Tagetes erecta]